MMTEGLKPATLPFDVCRAAALMQELVLIPPTDLRSEEEERCSSAQRAGGSLGGTFGSWAPLQTRPLESICFFDLTD